MKKILAILLALNFIVTAVFAQDDEIRPAAIGVGFILNDFTTAERIRSTSLSTVLNNKQWAKVKEMSPGIAISYFKGLRKHIDFAGTLAGSFVSYSLPGRPDNSDDKFLLEADVSLNLKMVSERYWVQPYLIAGVGAQMYGGTYFGAFIPTGLGLKVNLYDDTHFFVTSQYRIPVTAESVEYRFLYQFGVAGRIGKKKEPALKPVPPMPLDTDKDGIADDVDKCPSIPGLAKYDGCPVPDTDKDGINDEEDKCPSVSGLARYQGCPVPDTDKDGINDEEDKCPAAAGPASNQGCPLVDTDKDGLVDSEDKCPNVAGPLDNFGCPVIGIKSYQIVFKVGSSTLLPEGKLILDTVVAYLKRNAEVKVTIDGHTDNTGSDRVNNPLSKKRADATKAYLTSKGIDADRMTTAGYGSTRPVADNKTAQGRRLNRRIEIRIQ